MVVALSLQVTPNSLYDVQEAEGSSPYSSYSSAIPEIVALPKQLCRAIVVTLIGLGVVNIGVSCSTFINPCVSTKVKA